MSVDTLQREFAVSDAELHRFVAHALEDGGDGSRRLVALERKLSDYHSSFAIEEVTAVFADGAQLPLIFKNLSPDGLLNDAREARLLLDHDPAHEVWVYRHLLAYAQLGTAACYGVAADDARQRYWLLLEKVAGADLARTGDFAVWIAAARWLAGAHQRLTSVAGKSVIDVALNRYDQACFHQWVDQAEQALHQCHVAEGREVPAWEIRWLLGRARAAADFAASIPAKVIHGEFYPSNILIEARSNGPRICAIDWETAGIGPPLLDLAALIAGSWSPRQKDELANAYLSARSDNERLQREGFHWTALRCCSLLLAMKWIGLSRRWRPPPEHRYDWLAEALELARRLNADLQ